MKQKGLVQPEASLEELFINTSGAPEADEGIFSTTSIFGGNGSDSLKHEADFISGCGGGSRLTEQLQDGSRAVVDG